MRTPKVHADGEALITTFISAITNLLTAETAKYSAELSEQETISALSSAGSPNGLYVQPQDIPPEVLAHAARSSLEAHLKKVQSGQLASTVEQQVAAQQQQAEKDFVGRKVDIEVLQKNKNCVESVWFHKNTGRESTTPFNGNRIRGKISEIYLKSNALVIKPLPSAKLLWPNREYYIVYVVDFETMQPNIAASLR